MLGIVIEVKYAKEMKELRRSMRDCYGTDYE